ncbi:glycosyltransferase [Miltoncostaea oceani]|uniref:glycosyltransferase n=1 Tax=Miltoncostaea oceani TaxID=2843216 RepID=UPI001C3E4E31|nr:glycosyltransferase [Miltoncostaea oceani]
MVEHPGDGGVPRHVADLAAALDPGEFEVVVACPPQSSAWRELQARPDISLVAMPGDRDPAVAHPRTLSRLRQLIASADVVHAHSTIAGSLVRGLARIQGRTDRCVFTPHAWSFWSGGRARARIFQVAERRCAPWTGAIIAVSDAEMRAGLDAGIGHVGSYHVVPNGIDLDRFAAPWAGEDGPVVHIGRLARQKRPDLLIEAFRRLHPAEPGCRLVLAGEGPLRGSIETTIRDAGLGTAISVLGERDDVPAILAGARCLVLASDYEGCPISAIEGLAAGTPVVATAVGGTPEVVTDGVTGLLVPPRDPDALAAAIGALWRDPVLGRSLGGAGREHARERFSRDRMAQGTMQVYRGIVRSATPR